MQTQTAHSASAPLRNNYSPLILFDTREPDPHPWSSYFSLEISRGTLVTGDISLVGCGELISIERKTLGDLISCLCTGRERFVKELQRAGRIPNFSVIVEASYRDILQGNYRSNMTPASAWGSIVALQERHGIPFYFAGDMATAAKLAESILLRWWRDHVNAVQSALMPGETLTLRGKRAGGREERKSTCRI